MPKKTSNKRATLNTIAERCNVNKGTVSRVLNGQLHNFHVSAEKIKEIKDAAIALNYKPHRMARVIRCNRTYLIGVSSMKLDRIENTANLENFTSLAKFIQAAESHPLFKKYDMVLHIRHEDEKAPLTELDFKSDLLEGMIYLLPSDNHKEFLEIASPVFPIVLVGNISDSTKKVPCIDINNRKAAKNAVDYLIDSGRKNIITLVPENNRHVQCFKDRISGYKDALSEAKIPATKQQIHFIPCEEGAVYDFLINLEILKETDAVFCQMDELAAHCITALKRLNYGIPDDIAVIGFDDSMICQQTTPTLSSVRRPIEKQAYQAIDTLLNILEKNRDYTPGFTEIETELVKRESTEGTV